MDPTYGVCGLSVADDPALCENFTRLCASPPLPLSTRMKITCYVCDYLVISQQAMMCSLSSTTVVRAPHAGEAWQCHGLP